MTSPHSAICHLVYPPLALSVILLASRHTHTHTCKPTPNCYSLFCLSPIKSSFSSSLSVNTAWFWHTCWTALRINVLCQELLTCQPSVRCSITPESIKRKVCYQASAKPGVAVYVWPQLCWRGNVAKSWRTEALKHWSWRHQLYMRFQNTTAQISSFTCCAIIAHLTRLVLIGQYRDRKVSGLKVI